jgi:hypothetical protein
LDSIVYFDGEDGALSTHISICLTGDWAAEFGYVVFFADLIYDGTHVSLADCRLEEAQ